MSVIVVDCSSETGLEQVALVAGILKGVVEGILAVVPGRKVFDMVVMGVYRQQVDSRKLAVAVTWTTRGELRSLAWL